MTATLRRTRGSVPAWRIQDLIDFEHFRHEDSRRSAEELHRRDRGLYLSFEASIASTNVGNRDLLRLWLDQRRHFSQHETTDSTTPRCGRTPGECYDECFRWSAIALIILGLVTGCVIVRGLCHYDGQTPIDVLDFVKWFIVAQYIFSIVLFIIKFIPLGRAHPEHAYPQLLILWLMRRLGAWRRGGTGGVAQLRARASIYKNVWYRPLASLNRAFMLSLNLGAWGMFILLGYGTDLAFTWQSSRSSPEEAGALVRCVSAPWAWLGKTGPTLDQIRESRFVKARGTATLSDQAVKAWIPFLFGVITFYGVGLRTIHLAVERIFLERRAIRKLSFDDVECRRILDRMTRDLVEIRRAPEPGPPGAILPRSSGRCEPASIEANSESDHVVLLWALGDEPAGLRAWVSQHLKWADAKICKIHLTSADDWFKPDRTRELLIVVNGRRPPSGDFKRFVKRVAAGPCAPRVRILDCRAGSQEHDQNWENELQAMGNRYVDTQLLKLT